MEYYTMLARQHFGYQKIVPRKPLQGYLKLLLPDILDYDYTSSEGYPNGRNLTDDTIDIQLAVLTNERVTSDKVSSHQDLLATFPYLGSPHPIAYPSPSFSDLLKADLKR
jgi:hypothetical protein